LQWLRRRWQKPAAGIDTGKTDTTKADLTKVKNDTLKGDTLKKAGTPKK
jgi:hypothetical protein